MGITFLRRPFSSMTSLEFCTCGMLMVVAISLGQDELTVDSRGAQRPAARTICLKCRILAM